MAHHQPTRSWRRPHYSSVMNWAVRFALGQRRPHTELSKREAGPRQLPFKTLALRTCSGSARRTGGTSRSSAPEAERKEPHCLEGGNSLQRRGKQSTVDLNHPRVTQHYKLITVLKNVPPFRLRALDYCRNRSVLENSLLLTPDYATGVDLVCVKHLIEPRCHVLNLARHLPDAAVPERSKPH